MVDCTLSMCDLALIITFAILLIAAIYILVTFFVCDNHRCKAYVDADFDATGDRGRLGVEALNQSIWALAFVGGAIAMGLILTFGRMPMDIINCSIVFFISFVVIYFILSFYIHHFIRPVIDSLV